MDLYPRIINLPEMLEKKSFFLLGPRATGKSTLIRSQLPDCRVYDLLDAEVFQDLLRRPKLIEEQNAPGDWVVIDEVQKLPSLLDEVHRLIEKRGMRFLLTGSSARKLRRGAANLLAGRAWQASLFPLCRREIPDFDLLAYLNRGGLPAVYGSAHPDEELRGYAGLYLQEEIQAEALTRRLVAFSRFLELVALSNGEEISFESFAQDCGVSPGTAKGFFQVLEDTLIGFPLPAFGRTRKRKAISRSKFYLFDLGVTNQLARRGEIRERSELFGKAFEHWIVLETRAALSYRRRNEGMSYWRSTSQFEVDLIIGNRLAVEIKATSGVADRQLKGLRALRDEGLIERYVVVSLESERRVTDDGIEILPWREYLRLLWEG